MSTTVTEHKPSAEQQTSTALICGKCGAPVAVDQRYCVQCASRQPQTPDPAMAFFAAAASARRTRRAAPGSTGGSRVAMLGLFFVVLPLAVALGVLVGRGHSNNDSALLAALSHQRTITQTIAAPTGSAAAVAPATSTTSSAPATASSTTPTTPATPYKPTAAQAKQDATAVTQQSAKKGANYVSGQNALPNEIQVP